MSIYNYNPEEDVELVTQLAVLMDDETEQAARFDLIKRLDAYLDESVKMMERLADPSSQEDQEQLRQAKLEREQTRALFESLS